MITLANFEAQVAHLNAEAFASGVSGGDAVALPATNADAMHVADHLWKTQWLQFFRGADPLAEIDQDGSLIRARVHRERYQKSPNYSGIFSHLADYVGLFSSNDAKPPHTNIHERDAIDLAIDPLSVKFQQIEERAQRVSLGHPIIQPRLALNLVSPLERAILFVLGEIPISFSLKRTMVHGKMEEPVILPLHDLYHFAVANEYPYAKGIIRAMIYAALMTFFHDALSNPVLANGLDHITETQCFDLEAFGKRVEGNLFDICRRARLIGVREEEIDNFLAAFLKLLRAQSVDQPLFRIDGMFKNWADELKPETLKAEPPKPELTTAPSV